jgi:glucokinase
MESTYVIGIDLGGTKIKGIISDELGNILVEDTIQTMARDGEKAVLDRIMLVIDNLIEKSHMEAKAIKAIGIGSPGPLDAKRGIIFYSPNLPFKNFQLVDPIAKKYGIPTYLDNDANVAAIGEHTFGAGRGTRNMIYITVSTGIGGGAILNGSIYRGNTSNALEIGHMTLKKDGPKCNCGNYGCLEALASGTAIGKQAREAVVNGEVTSLRNYKEVTSYEVFKEAENGDDVAIKILDESLTYLGIGMANLIEAFDPEMIVIGGGVTKGGQIVFDKVREEVNKRCMKVMSESCRIVPPGLGVDSGAIGAAALAITEMK